MRIVVLYLKISLKTKSEVMKTSKLVTFKKLPPNWESIIIVFANIKPRDFQSVIQEFIYQKIVIIQIGTISILIYQSNHIDSKEICLMRSPNYLLQSFVNSNLSIFYKEEHNLFHRLYAANKTSRLKEDRNKVCLSSSR